MKRILAITIMFSLIGFYCGKDALFDLLASLITGFKNMLLGIPHLFPVFEFAGMKEIIIVILIGCGIIVFCKIFSIPLSKKKRRKMMSVIDEAVGIASNVSTIASTRNTQRK